MADPPSYPGMPPWVKISGMIAIVLAVLVLVVIFTGVGAPHGPGRHLSPYSATEPGPQQP